MQLSRRQVAAFSEEAANRFEERMVGILRDYLPQRCDELGEEKLREIIRLGLARAPRYGIGLECDVARYISLMIGVDPDFDRDPGTAWAGLILRDESLDADQKLAALFEGASRPD